MTRRLTTMGALLALLAACGTGGRYDGDDHDSEGQPAPLLQRRP